MNPVRTPLILRVGVVLFAISLMGGYVVFSQNQAKPRVVRGTKSAPVLEEMRMLDASVSSQAFPTEQAAVTGKQNVVMPSSKLGLVFKDVRLIDPAGETLRSDDDFTAVAPSMGDTAILSTKSGAPLVPPQIIRLRPNWLTPTPPVEETKRTIRLQRTGPVSTSGSNSVVPGIPQGGILHLPASENPVPLIGPGSKVKVPIIRVQSSTQEVAKPEGQR